MGAPMSSIVAEIFVQTFESKAITTHQHKVKIWERHVDDIFAIIKKQHTQEFLNHLNNLHPNIKFSIEAEQDSTLPFLDTLLKRHSDKSISVNIYRKPTHTDQCLHFTSHHNYKAKQNVITTLFERAQTVISNKKEIKNEEDHLRKQYYTQTAISSPSSTNHSPQLLQTKRKTKPFSNLLRE